MRHLERAEPVPARHGWSLAIADRTQERIDLAAERVGLGHLALLEAERRKTIRPRLAAADEHPSFAVVDRKVRVGLEDAELPLALEGHAARGDVGDATVGEAQPRVGDVDGIGQDGDADRLHRAQRRRHHAEDDVEVVDHEVQHDVDVGAALGERREAVTLDEARLADDAVERADRRVEALEMADLQHAPAADGELEQRLALVHRRGERLLDQHVDPGVEQVARDGVVQLGRDGDARAVDPAGERAVIGDGLDAERGRDGAGTRGVDVGDRDELGRRIRRVLLRVKPTEVSNRGPPARIVSAGVLMSGPPPARPRRPRCPPRRRARSSRSDRE